MTGDLTRERLRGHGGEIARDKAMGSVLIGDGRRLSLVCGGACLFGRYDRRSARDFDHDGVYDPHLASRPAVWIFCAQGRLLVPHRGFCGRLVAAGGCPPADSSNRPGYASFPFHDGGLVTRPGDDASPVSARAPSPSA